MCPWSRVSFGRRNLGREAAVLGGLGWKDEGWSLRLGKLGLLVGNLMSSKASPWRCLVNGNGVADVEGSFSGPPM